MRYTALVLAALLLTLPSNPLSSQAADSGTQPGDSSSPRAQTYRVEPGDTLYSIARSFGVSEEQLRRANAIDDPRSLGVGQDLVIPNTYRAVPGDTYWSIAQRHDMSVEDLLRLNDRGGDSVLRAGDVLLVASPTSQSRAASTDGADADGAAGAEAGRDSNKSVEGAADSSSSGRVASEAVDSPEVSEEEAGPAADASAAVGVAEAGGPAEADGRPGVSVGKQAEVAATDPSGRRTVLWPHPGDRRPVDGKFPGIAISARAGDAVYSVSTGRVIYAGPHTAFGRVVFVRTDDGYLYVYAGNSELSVQVGDRVRVGTRIGSVGPGGGAAGAGGDAARPGGTAVEAGQLYFSVWKNDEYVDPTDAPRG